MRTIKKSNVTTNAMNIPSVAADMMKIGMYAFIRKNIATLKQMIVAVIQFREKDGTIRQTEDIVFNATSLPDLENYGAVLKVAIDVNGRKTTCYKDFKEFIRKGSYELPVRMYYDEGYGWMQDIATGRISFNGSSIVGLGDIVLDEYEHHLSKKGELALTVKICNEVMRDRVASQFLIAASLAAPIFGALSLKSLLINVSGESSQGKSTILKLCMSMWSNPNDEKISDTWYNTENAICARLNNIEGVPFLLDDTSQNNNKNFTGISYNLEEGKSKGRLNKLFKVDSIARWHTCIFSASEVSMYEKIDEDKKGVFRRLCELDVEKGSLIEDEKQASKVASIIKENYGNLGIAFIQRLFKERLTDNDFKDLSGFLDDKRLHLQAEIGSSGIAKGLGEKLAVVLLASKLGKDFLGLKFDFVYLTEYIKGLIATAEVKAAQALIIKQGIDTCYKTVCEFAEKLPDRFKTEINYNIPVGYFNIWELKLGYGKYELREEFEKHGYCDFTTQSADKGLDNTVRIVNENGKGSKPEKVITVVKPL